MLVVNLCLFIALVMYVCMYCSYNNVSVQRCLCLLVCALFCIRSLVYVHVCDFQVTDAYNEFDASRVIRLLQGFISRDLSSFYFSIVKDRYRLQAFPLPQSVAPGKIMQQGHPCISLSLCPSHLLPLSLSHSSGSTVMRRIRLADGLVRRFWRRFWMA